MVESPARIRNGRLDFLAANSLGRALYAPMFGAALRPVNKARFACTAEPGSPGADALTLLAGWAATNDSTAAPHGDRVPVSGTGTAPHSRTS